MQHLPISATHRDVSKKPYPSKTLNIFRINTPGSQPTDLLESSRN